MQAIQNGSPNERFFGVGPGMFKNLGETLCAAIVGVAIAALGIGYTVGQWAAGATFVATLGMAGVSAIAGIAIAALAFQCIKDCGVKNVALSAPISDAEEQSDLSTESGTKTEAFSMKKFDENSGIFNTPIRY
jgi:hypothetical protein